MATFPDSKNEILILAANVVEGINQNPNHFANPPFDPSLLNQRVTEEISIIARRQAKEAEMKALVEEDEAKMAEIIELLRALLDLAEAKYPKDAAILKELAWDIRADRRYLKPGQVRNLEAEPQGPGSVLLDWKAPARTKSVGATSGYRIERHIHDFNDDKTVEDWGKWQFNSYETEETLHDQPRGVEISYRIVPTNRTGDGPASDVETVVL